MKKQALFIQGGGENGYAVDAKLVASLEKALGKEYTIHYPEIKADKAAADFGWLKQIGAEIDKVGEDTILIAHSFGASLLLKYLSEHKVPRRIAGVFLLATPFWDGEEDWQKGIKLGKDFAKKLPEHLPLFFYHSRDDEEVPFEQMDAYQRQLPEANFRVLEHGGHQLDNDLELVAEDIREL